MGWTPLRGLWAASWGGESSAPWTTQGQRLFNQIPGSGPLEKRSVLPLSDSFSFLRSPQRHLLSRSCLPFSRSFCTSVPQHALIRSSPVISRSSGAGFHTFPKAALYLPGHHSLMNAAGCGTCSVSGGGKTLDMAMSTIPWHSSA